MKKYLNFKLKLAILSLCVAIGVGTIISNAAFADTLNGDAPVISDNYLRGVEEGLKCKSFKQMYTNDTHGSEYSVYDHKGNVITVANVAHTISTGDYIVDVKNNVYTIVVTGDLNGNGKVETSDTALLKMHFAATYNLTGAIEEAADTNNDGKVNAGDYIRIKYHIQSKYNIHENESFNPDEPSSDESYSNEYDESGWTDGWQ